MAGAFAPTHRIYPYPQPALDVLLDADGNAFSREQWCSAAPIADFTVHRDGRWFRGSTPSPMSVVAIGMTLMRVFNPVTGQQGRPHINLDKLLLDLAETHGGKPFIGAAAEPVLAFRSRSTFLMRYVDGLYALDLHGNQVRWGAGPVDAAWQRTQS